MFPDNTSQVWKLGNLPRTAVIEWQYTHEGELLQLAQLKTLLDHNGVPADLELPYLPYGRQDHLVGDHTCFALRPFASLLNSLGFRSVTIMDPHSEEATELIARSRDIYPFGALHCAWLETGASLACYPDDGAYTKYTALYSYPNVSCRKMRNAATGEITRLTLEGDVKDHHVLIIDDICDGGATFIRVANLLYEKGAATVDLFVTHGLFSKGLRPLRDARIERIYTKHGKVKKDPEQ